MNAKQFSFKAELLSEQEIDQIADCIVRKLMHYVPALANGNDQKQVDLPIKMRDVCRLLQVSDTTIRAWMAKGIIPFHRKGNRVFFFKAEVLKSLETPLDGRKEGKRCKF